jgi:hypothetical protein
MERLKVRKSNLQIDLISYPPKKRTKCLPNFFCPI